MHEIIRPKQVPLFKHKYIIRRYVLACLQLCIQVTETVFYNANTEISAHSIITPIKE